MNAKKTLSVLLAAMMLASAFTSCSNGGNDSKESDKNGTQENKGSESQNESSANTETETEETKYTASIPDGLNYGDADFTIYTYPESGGSIYWCDMDFCYRDVTGETLNDALYQRILDTETTLGLTIKTFAPADNAGGTLKKSTQAQDGLYDIAFVNCRACDSLAQENLILNMRSIDNLDLDAAWWDQNIIDGLSVANRVYMLHGDISIMAKKTLRVIYMNKSIANNYNIENPYPMLSEKTWTIDKMAEIVAQVSDDLNGDGKMTQGDRFGLLYSGNIIYPVMIGCGVQVSTKDENDMPVLSFYNEHTQSVWEKVTAMCWDTDHALSGDGVTLFMQDEGLFASFELHNLNKLREMESDFGILPNPLYDETQDNYYSTINGNVASMLVFPSDCPDTERAAYTVDVMGAISKNILTPAYIESYLKGKVSRDNESEESINIVFDSIRYDLGFCYSWGNLGSFVQQLFEQKKEGLATAYQTTSKIAQKQMDKAMEKYLENTSGN